jgi:hypothetical protein
MRNIRALATCLLLNEARTRCAKIPQAVLRILGNCGTLSLSLVFLTSGRSMCSVMCECACWRGDAFQNSPITHSYPCLFFPTKRATGLATGTCLAFSWIVLLISILSQCCKKVCNCKVLLLRNTVVLFSVSFPNLQLGLQLASFNFLLMSSEIIHSTNKWIPCNCKVLECCFAVRFVVPLLSVEVCNCNLLHFS